MPTAVRLLPLLVLCGSLPAADIILRPAETGTTPPLLGYNFSHSLAGGNTCDYLRYSGIRHMRVFLPKSLAEPLDDLSPWGDGVTDLASFNTRRTALRNDPLDPAYINWPYLLNRYENQMVSGNNRFRVNHAFREMRDLEIDILVQLTADLSAFPIVDGNDWAGRWELWQHYYFQAFHMAREFDVRRWSMFNEPNHSNAGGITPEEWLGRLRLASDAIQSAIADVNRIYGKSLEPLVYAPTTAGGSGPLDGWGLPALADRHTRYDGASDPAWRNFHVYSSQLYSANPDNFAKAIAAIRNGMAKQLGGSSAVPPIALTEWNVSTGANFDKVPESMDTPARFSRLGANAIALTKAKADHLYLFKFGMTASSGNYPVQKNGMHHVDNGTGTSVNRYGSATRGAEVWRHFVRAAGPGGSRPVLTLEAGSGVPDVTGQLTFDPVQDRLYAFLANRGADSVSLRFLLGDFGLAQGAPAIIEEVSSRHSGIIAHCTAVHQGRIGPFTMPGESTWLVTIPRAPRQSAGPVGPTLLIPASAAVTVRDGTRRTAVQPAAPWLEVRHDPVSADGRAAALIKTILPPHRPDDIEFAVLTLNVATGGSNADIHAHLYGLDDASWDPAATIWAGVANLRQNAAPGRQIRDSVIAGQGESAHLLAQIVVNSPSAAERHIDITGFVKARLGREVAFLILQEPRWDVTLPGLEAGDAQPDGLRIVSTAHPEAASLSPRIRFVRRSGSNGGVGAGKR